MSHGLVFSTDWKVCIGPWTISIFKSLLGFIKSGKVREKCQVFRKIRKYQGNFIIV